MATRKTAGTFVGVDALKHSDDKRKNIPTAEYQSLMADEARKPVQVSYPRGTSNADGLQAEKQQRNRDLDPQLVWRGKDEQDWTDLVVNAPPLYIQEKVHPKVLIDDLLRQSRERREAAEAESAGGIADMFGDFNGIPAGADKTDFYAHDQNWTNRMILGDSLQVMASLAEREGLRGKVQCVYLDPPYGIKFNSNFQWSTTSRAFNYEAHAAEFEKLGRVPVLKARMNPDLHMAGELKNTGAGNLFVVFGEPDIRIEPQPDGLVRVRVKGVDVFRPQTGEIESGGTDSIALWMIDTAYNEESFFVRQAYFLGAADPYKALKTTLKAEIDADAWATLHSDVSRPFEKPGTGRIAVKVINHLGDEVMKVFGVS